MDDRRRALLFMAVDTLERYSSDVDDDLDSVAELDERLEVADLVEDFTGDEFFNAVATVAALAVRVLARDLGMSLDDFFERFRRTLLKVGQ